MKLSGDGIWVLKLSCGSCAETFKVVLNRQTHTVLQLQTTMRCPHCHKVPDHQPEHSARKNWHQTIDYQLSRRSRL